MRLLIININPSNLDTDGCYSIAEACELALRTQLGVEEDLIDIRVRHWRTVLDALGSLAPDLQKWGPQGIIIGPNGTPFPAYPAAFDRFLSWLRTRRGPTLGICGGHQAIALAHGAPIGPVHAVPAATESYEGMPKVCGRTSVRLLGDPDPILDGLPDEFEVVSSHVDEIKDIPPGFRLLALGHPSPTQILRADRRPFWGVQFHPERDDGVSRRILSNFLRFCMTRGRRKEEEEGEDSGEC